MEWWQRIIDWFVVTFCDHKLISDKQITVVECVKCGGRWYYVKDQNVFDKSSQ